MAAVHPTLLALAVMARAVGSLDNAGRTMALAVAVAMPVVASLGLVQHHEQDQHGGGDGDQVAAHFGRWRELEEGCSSSGCCFVACWTTGHWLTDKRGVTLAFYSGQRFLGNWHPEEESRTITSSPCLSFLAPSAPRQCCWHLISSSHTFLASGGAKDNVRWLKWKSTSRTTCVCIYLLAFKKLLLSLNQVKWTSMDGWDPAHHPLIGINLTHS